MRRKWRGGSVDRLAAWVVGVVGVVLLTFAAVAWIGPGSETATGGGVELLALVNGPLPDFSGLASGRTTPARPLAGASGGATTGRPDSATSVSAGRSSVPPVLLQALGQVGSGVRFEVGRIDLNAGSASLLDRLAPLLAARPDLVVEVRGHADNTGAVELNDALSRQRAQAVADYLVARGVSADQLRPRGMGADEPVADNSSPEGRSANRRSDMTLMEVDRR